MWSIGGHWPAQGGWVWVQLMRTWGSNGQHRHTIKTRALNSLIPITEIMNVNTGDLTQLLPTSLVDVLEWADGWVDASISIIVDLVGSSMDGSPKGWGDLPGVPPDLAKAPTPAPNPYGCPDTSLGSPGWTGNPEDRESACLVASRRIRIGLWRGNLSANDEVKQSDENGDDLARIKKEKRAPANTEEVVITGDAA